MTKNEDGEVELILGNGQLLGVFFIVVVLLAVFFVMGYLMGRSSGGGTSVEVASVRKPDVKPLVVDSPAPKSETPAAQGNAAPSQNAPTESTPAATKSNGTAQQAEKESAAATQTAKEPAPGEEPSGTYLQLAATTQHEAELEVDVLRKKSFHALSMEVPDKPGLFRVLVGPIPDGGVNKARADLEAAGFPGDKAIRKTF